MSRYKIFAVVTVSREQYYMTPALTLFSLRVVLAILLYLFIGGLFYLLWLDVKRAGDVAQARDRVRGQLVVIASDLPALRAGEVFPLLPVTSIGRAPTNTIHLPDETASMEHALISQRNGKWWLEDLGSRNGTHLNGLAVNIPTVISTGDVITLARIQLKLKLE
jgi:hypothetical protein